LFSEKAFISIQWNLFGLIDGIFSLNDAKSIRNIASNVDLAGSAGSVIALFANQID